jgi:predicted nucleic acid-binding protein
LSRYLCDTSCLVAAVCSWHERHETTRSEIERRDAGGEKLFLAAHSLAETYAVLTRLPSPHRLRAADAIALIESNWGRNQVVHLTGRETWRAIAEAERRGLIGGQTYDVLIAMAAVKGGASTLVTWNLRNFSPFRDEFEVIAPS